MTGKYVDIDYIMDQMAEFHPYITDVSKRKVAEYIWKITRRLGLEDMMYDRIAVIDIEDFRGVLPNDICDIEEGMVRDYESKIPLAAITDEFYRTENKTTFETVRQLQVLQEFCTTVPTDSELQIYTYKLTENHIYTGFEEGQVEMAYRAFPVDKYGMPLVVDNEKIIDAIVSYIAMMYAKTMVMMDKLSANKYGLLEQEYLFNLASARSAGKIPDHAEMNTIRNRIHSPNDGSRMFETRFRDHGKKLCYYD